MYRDHKKPRLKIQPQGSGLLLIVMLAAVPALCTASSAPLDTLRSEMAMDGEMDSRYTIPTVELSRKGLPDVQATVVPQSGTPNRPPRLIHPLSGDWFFQEARRADAGDDAQARRDLLRQARAIEPDNPRYQWWQTSLAVRTFDTPTLIKLLPQVLGTLLDSPVARGHLAVRLHQGTLLTVAWFWTLLVLAISLGWWRHLAHDLGAMIFKNRNHPLRLWLPLILPLAFAALRPGWLGWLALMSVALLIQTRGRVRILLAATWLSVILLVFPAWPPLRLAPPTVDPESEVTLLVKACRQDPTGPVSDRLRQALDTAQDPARRARLQLALGIQEARRGRFQTSDGHFKEALKNDPDCFGAMVGLANNTYFRGSLDRALTRFEQARQVHPDRGEVGYNMAQVYFKKLFIPEATAALEESRRLGFLVPTHMDQKTRRQGYSPVVYPGLSNASLLAACAFEANQYPPLVTLAAWQGWLGSPPIPLFLVLAVPLVLATALILLWSRQNDPRECENCGVPLCRDCCRVREGAWLCPACGETASRSKSDVVLATLMKNRSRDEGLGNTQRLVRLGRMIPGAGHLGGGQFASAWWRLAMTSWAFSLLTLGWIFDSGASWSSPGLRLATETVHPVWLPLPTALWGGWTSLPVLVGGSLLLVVWIIGLLDGPGLRRGTPERLSWAPSGSDNPAPAPHPSRPMEPVEPPAGIAVGPGLKR